MTSNTRLRGRSAALLVAFLAITAQVTPTTSPARADWVRDRQWYLHSLKIETVHGVSRGGGTVVGLIDTGVDATHPDLARHVLPGIDLTGTRGGNGTGRVDTSGHGTAMAGLIAGQNRESQVGILGIAPEAKILPVRVIHGVDLGNAPLASGIRWAIAQGARVLCIAVGSTERDEQIAQAVTDAIAADVVVVAAVGNTTDERTAIYPAAYPGVIAAGGLDRSGNHASISVASPVVVISAPAVDIVSTNIGGKYLQGSGTSNATAIIAGAAALVRSKYPTLPATEVIHRLTATATDKGPPGRDNEYGYGALNLLAALTATVPTATPTTPPPTAAAPPPATDSPRPLLPIVILLAGCALLIVAGAGAGVFLVLRNRR